MEQVHPSKDITGSESRLLSGKRIVFCVTGSVAAVRAADIARLLMRHGAEVFAVMSEAATHIIHPDLLHWATGNPVVTKLTGAIEHVALAGNVALKADCILVAPATANTIGKIAAGIDDTPVTSTVTAGIGEKIPLIIVPAMHQSMYEHPIVQENIGKLNKYGVTFLLPAVEEGKAKIAEPDEILDAVIALVTKKKMFAGKRFLITLGRTVEHIDPIRVLTNNSTGKMGSALARAALLLGAQVTVVAGKISVPVPGSARRLDVSSADEMFETVRGELTAGQYDFFIGCAAVGDWKPEKAAAEKISTHKEKLLDLRLVPTRKIIDEVKAWSPETFLVAFRAVHGLQAAALVDDAAARLEAARADLIVANDAANAGNAFEADTNAVTVVGAKREVFNLPRDTKQNIAFSILTIIHEQATGKSKE
jgi:phosphopantothenoylcysteine decarboxylase/phosphopantothenate--cysteine ligase